MVDAIKKQIAQELDNFVDSASKLDSLVNKISNSELVKLHKEICERTYKDIIFGNFPSFYTLDPLGNVINVDEDLEKYLSEEEIAKRLIDQIDSLNVQNSLDGIDVLEKRLSKYKSQIREGEKVFSYEKLKAEMLDGEYSLKTVDPAGVHKEISLEYLRNSELISRFFEEEYYQVIGVKEQKQIGKGGNDILKTKLETYNEKLVKIIECSKLLQDISITLNTVTENYINYCLFHAAIFEYLFGDKQFIKNLKQSISVEEALSFKRRINESKELNVHFLYAVALFTEMSSQLEVNGIKKNSIVDFFWSADKKTGSELYGVLYNLLNTRLLLNPASKSSP